VSGVVGRSTAVEYFASIVAVMNRMTGRQADCDCFSTSEGKSDAEVVPEAAGSQTPLVLILRSFLFIENHEKPA
jgi:hypothetical protein